MASGFFDILMIKKKIIFRWIEGRERKKTHRSLLLLYHVYNKHTHIYTHKLLYKHKNNRKNNNNKAMFTRVNIVVENIDKVWH